MTTRERVEERQLIIDAETVRSLPRDQMDPGVTYTLLWQRHGSSAGLLRLEAGAAVPEHHHSYAEHHVWLVDGRARVDGRMLEPGAYWHVPPGVSHSVSAPAGTGCTLFYLYLRR
jgi:quercetin dioxygenase-like cupin family protein